MLIEVQCEVSTVSDDLGCHVICWCWSTVFSEVHSQQPSTRKEHFMLPSADKLYGDADFIFLKAVIKVTCASITPEQCHRLIASMSHRIDVVIHAKGGSSKY